MNAHVRWASEPDRCRCALVIVGTLQETLGCPLRWWPVPGGRWAHIPGGAR